MIKGDASLIKATAHPNTLLVGAGGGNVSDTVYTSDIDFAYKTVYLTADLNMGGKKTGSSWTGPNYTPVGGKFSIDTDMVDGDSYVIDTRFNGVFDGRGHTVSNIYCQRYSDKGFPYSMAVGLVGYLGGGSDVSGLSGEFTGGWQPAVRNVIVGEGYIKGRRMVGGVVGRVGETSDGVIIESCANHADVMNTDAKGVGGILGSSGGEGVIRNCYNTGNVSTTYSCPAGGIIGANDGISIYNCYNVGTINSNGATRGRGIGGHDTGTYTVSNCYSLKGCDDDPDSEGYYKGTSRKITVEVTQMSASDMASDSLTSKLNINGSAFTRVSGVNNGYPVLLYEAGGYPEGSYTVTVTQGQNGSISVNSDGTAAPGQTVGFSCQPDAGYKLNYYTVNGKPVSGDFYIATENMNVSAVFTNIRSAAVSYPSSSDYSIVVTATGYVQENGALKVVRNYPIQSGTTVMEDSVILVRASVYGDAAPADSTQEYTGIVAYNATNAVKNSVGTYTVTGEGPVEITITPETQASTWTAHTDTSWFSAKRNTYTITTPEQLAGLATLVNEEGLTFEGKTIKLGADISLAGGAGGRIWIPVGQSEEKAFHGTFDGQGHVIGAMNCASGSSSYSGLFGFCTGATIKDLIIRGTSSSDAGMAYSAGFAAYAEGSTFQNCVSFVKVTTSGDYAGGIVAYTTDGTTLENCQNYGNVQGGTGVGGIAGVCQSTSDLITGCVNAGSVSSDGAGLSGTGGVVGKHVGLISDCINVGAVSGNDRYTGGVVGYTNGRKTSRITGSQNQGTVTSSSAADTAALGGVIGYAQFGTYYQCSSMGKVTPGSGFKSSGVGAFIGHIGNEPALSAAAECYYTSGAYNSAVNKGSYEGVSEKNDIEAMTYEPVSDPGDPADTSVKGGSSAARVSEINGGQTIGSGSYYLMNYAAGQLVISPGADVTLVGTGRTLGALTIEVGSGASLTLKDVEITGDETLLNYTGGGKLTLTGASSLVGQSDTDDGSTPTIQAKGVLTIGGTGSLYLEAQRWNSALNLQSGSTLNITGGLLSIYKKELMTAVGGGAICAGGSTVNISGGSVEGLTDSDNISVISGDRVNISGGSVNLRAIRSPKVIDAKTVNVTGGTVRASGHSGNSVDEALRRDYKGAAAIPNLTGTVSYYSETGSFKSAVASRQKIVVDGESVDMEIYNIDGYNYFKLRDIAALMTGTKSEFSVDYNGDLLSMHTVKGSQYKAVGGEMLTGQDKSSSCKASTWALYVNGKLVNCKVYNIGGNNFFKLRDLGDAYGIGVTFDQATNTAYINS